MPLEIKQPEDDQFDPTDNDTDEGLAYLGGCEKHQPTPDDYDYAEKVRKGKQRKALVWKIIANLSFWMYLIFNFIKDMWGA